MQDEPEDDWEAAAEGMATPSAAVAAEKGAAAHAAVANAGSRVQCVPEFLLPTVVNAHSLCMLSLCASNGVSSGSCHVAASLNAILPGVW